MPTLPEPTTIILDSSALLALLGDEPGGELVEAILHAASRGEVQVLAPTLCIGEAMTVAVRSLGADRIDDLRTAIGQLPITPLPLEMPELVDAALARLAWSLDFAEAAAAGAARTRAAVLVTANPLFTGFEQAGGWVYWIGPEARRNEPTLFDPMARFGLRSQASEK